VFVKSIFYDVFEIYFATYRIPSHVVEMSCKSVNFQCSSTDVLKMNSRVTCNLPYPLSELKLLERRAHL